MLQMAAATYNYLNLPNKKTGITPLLTAIQGANRSVIFYTTPINVLGLVIKANHSCTNNILIFHYFVNN